MARAYRNSGFFSHAVSARKGKRLPGKGDIRPGVNFGRYAPAKKKYAASLQRRARGGL